MMILAALAFIAAAGLCAALYLFLDGLLSMRRHRRQRTAIEGAEAAQRRTTTLVAYGRFIVTTSVNPRMRALVESAPEKGERVAKTAAIRKALAE
jgi:hypothetical protein